MVPTSNTIVLQIGQRWWWANKTLVEVLEPATFRVGDHNSIRCKVVQITADSYRSLGEITTWTFGNCLDRWEYLEGQDAPQGP